MVADDDTTYTPISCEHNDKRDVISSEKHDDDESSKNQTENLHAHVMEHDVGDICAVSFENNIFMAVVKLNLLTAPSYCEADLYS